MVSVHLLLWSYLQSAKNTGDGASDFVAMDKAWALACLRTAQGCDAKLSQYMRCQYGTGELGRRDALAVKIVLYPGSGITDT